MNPRVKIMVNNSVSFVTTFMFVQYGKIFGAKHELHLSKLMDVVTLHQPSGTQAEATMGYTSCIIREPNPAA
jgi:hypothetical protein